MKIWTMSQNELIHETLIKLNIPSSITMGSHLEQTEQEEDAVNNQGEDDDDANFMDALCSCFDFNPFMEHLYLVGTEDGHIMECCKTYNDGFTKIFCNAHYMNIYAIKWNPFHSKIFLSCSEDWTIKLWEMGDERNNDQKKEAANIGNEQNVENEPIITYDLGCSINDIAWSPFSSTIFAAGYI
eukprot:TRINITY_DN15202_c0_g1_i1.p1 TRINITY_DN15202_c0_g1~~TRINITY_DN15202_c0_g1_i1.p1  ORF type:complete len:184 (-),score=23.49 TRINITY_DN15202_c0_g1_i1:402-953(-)